MIIQQFQNQLNTLTANTLNSFKFQTNNTKNRYINLIDNIYSIKQDFGTSTLLHVFEEIDKTFRDSIERKDKYHIQAYNYRTILTSLGEIRFKRTIYKNKFTGKCYTHLDTVLGLDKYKYLDPKLEAVLIAKMANYSMAEAARQINAIVSKSFDKPKNYVSRQLARNIMLRCDFDYDAPKIHTSDTITIMLDEKYVKLQRPSSSDTKSVMIKSAVIYDGIKRIAKSRTKLVNKRVFIGIDNFKNNLYDFICTSYDIDKIKRINVIGDGAKWIKAVGDDLRSTDYKVKQYIDLFHFRKALHNITKDDEIKLICEDYIKNLVKKNTVNLFDVLEINTKIGLESKEYIINNFSRIKSTLKDKISCSMEGHISHNLASLYASRPRGYSVRSLNILIKLREAHLNGVDIAKEMLKKKNTSTNRINIDYSSFDNLHKDTYSLPQHLKMIH